MIDIRDMEFHYRDGTFSLKVPELTLDEGSTVAMIGPSGTGKTTLLDLMAGNRTPHRGSVKVMGQSVGALSDAERRRFRIMQIGLVFQEFELLEYLSVLDNILLPYRITPALTLDAGIRQRAAALAERVGIGNKLRRNARLLSQGERQRVAVCRALLPEPKLLLCDEPTGNLDPANKQQVLDILLDYTERNHSTLVVVTHNHDLLPRFQRVVDFKMFTPQITQMHADG